MRDAPVTFVVPGDLHLTEAGLDNHRVASWMVDEVNALVRPDFVQFIGDNVQDATDDQFRLFLELAGRLEAPHHVLVGDHDVHDDAAAVGFGRHVGGTFGASSIGGFRFLRLNTQESRPVGLSPGQVGWFRAEVDAAIARGERVVVFQHNYPYQIWEDFAGPGVDAWREVVQTRRIGAIFAGHTHYGQVANDGRNVAIATRSIGDPEGGPPGYTLAHVHGEDLAITYRTAEDRGPIALITHPRDRLLATGPAHVVRGPGRALVRTWSARPLIRARCRPVGREWTPLEMAGPGAWSTPIDGSSLAKGEHRFEVEIVDDHGHRARAEVDFLVDPTGRYTAVPSARPPVSSTRFC